MDRNATEFMLLMNARTKKWIWFGLRWGVAVVGVWWVVANLSLRDHALVLDAGNIPHDEPVLAQRDGEFQVLDVQTNRTEWVRSRQLVSAPDRKTVQLQDGSTRKLLGLRLAGDINHLPRVVRVLVLDPATGRGVWLSPDRLKGYRLQVPHAPVQMGLISMCRRARPIFLIGAVGIFPICFFLVSVRWKRLMRALDIHISYYKTFVLYMVGNFYNTFLPGSTGGDVLKAVYVARMTPYRTRAVVSVLVDRVIGMLALMILGGCMAAYQYVNFAVHGAINDPVAHRCMQVALVCCGILAVTAFVFYVLFHPALRRKLDPLIDKIPARKHVRQLLDVMETYRNRPGLIAWALAITLPVHTTVVISAMLAGMAFGLPISPIYYFVAVPVIVLVGAIPISPQGAGVMEFFAVILLQTKGATVGQAVALTMSMRVVQIFWNLIGGIWVATGGYHPPTEAERDQLDTEAQMAG